MYFLQTLKPKEIMLPLKFVTSLFSSDKNSFFFNHFSNHHDNNSSVSRKQSNDKIPLMIFIPTQELVTDTYRLAKIARTIGMDFNPNSSLSHIIFSWPFQPNDTVPLPFPTFKTATLTHLRLFANLSKGYFKLAFFNKDFQPTGKIESLSNYNWHCTSLSLFFAQTGEKIETMDGFSKALLGTGWTLFKTSCHDVEKSGKGVVYLYRKLDVYKSCNGKEDSGESSSRVRELRLPELEFGNVSLRILQYILLMTDQTFCLA